MIQMVVPQVAFFPTKKVIKDSNWLFSMAHTWARWGSKGLNFKIITITLMEHSICLQKRMVQVFSAIKAI